MKVLILSFYYPPDLSAGSFRMKALISALEWQGNGDVQVELVTTQPNRYHSLASTAPAEENHGWLTIRRFTLPAHKSGMRDQALAFLAFARAARAYTKRGHYDLVFATSSRLMTAVLGAHIARRARAPLYLDVRDLFTDTMGDLLRGSPLRLLLPVFRLAERWAFRSAACVNLVSPGFVDYVKAIAPGAEISLFTNGIDAEFLEEDFSAPTVTEDVLPLVLYAGNIGDGQGLHAILPEAAKKLAGKARFRVVGDGGRRAQLEAGLKEACTDNVELLPPVPRAELLDHYRQATVLFLHLNDHKVFHKVLPSKIFEYAATGKPILAGVSGFAARFVGDEVRGAEVFAPCDADGMVRGVEALLAEPRHFDRDEFCRAHARAGIMERMAKSLLDKARPLSTIR